MTGSPIVRRAGLVLIILYKSQYETHVVGSNTINVESERDIFQKQIGN